jgi:hypothetical protein
MPATLALAATLALGGPCVVAPAARGAGPTVGVSIHQASGRPSTYFALNARPGTLAHAGLLVVSNPTGRAVTVSLEPVNGLTTSTLGSTYATANRTRLGSTRWLTLSAHRLAIAPHASANVAVAVLVPRSAEPGDYLSGIAVQTQEGVQKAQPARGLEIGQAYRYAIGVETRLPGRRQPHIRFTAARVMRYPGSVTFLLLASNDGNVILKDVYGNVTITQGSRQVLARTIAPGTFVSHTSIQLPESAPHEQPSAGTVYRVRAKLVYGSGAAYLDTDVSFGRGAAAVQALYTRPRHGGNDIAWPALVGLIGALASAAGAAAWWWRRRPPFQSDGDANAGLDAEQPIAQVDQQ